MICTIILRQGACYLSEDEELSEEELNTLAMSSEVGPLDVDAKPWTGVWNSSVSALPGWYMPYPSAVIKRKGIRIAIAIIIISFLAVDAAGLCVTSGFLSWA
jgi:hypothetical protein